MFTLGVIDGDAEAVDWCRIFGVDLAGLEAPGGNS
jgi:hypothetical protein